MQDSSSRLADNGDRSGRVQAGSGKSQRQAKGTGGLNRHCLAAAEAPLRGYRNFSPASEGLFLERLRVLSPTQKPTAPHVVDAVGLRVNRSSRRWSAYLYALGWSDLASPPDSFCKLSQL